MTDDPRSRASIMLVAGARPNFMKVAPIAAALDRAGIAHSLVHTGQHYDDAMSDSFFRDLGLRVPDFHLGVGSGSHAAQTANVMQAFEPVLLEQRPSWLVVVGDVNSTLACALVAAKLRGETGTRVAHVEAGLRSGDWRMPEEINRVLTDRLAHVLFLSSHDARENLLAEGIPEDRIVFAGNVMVDTLFLHLTRARAIGRADALGLTAGEYALATLHRPSNVDDPAALRVILEAFGELSKERGVVFPMHPRTRAMVERFELGRLMERLLVIPPEGYLDMLSLVATAAVVITDSGGLQEETTALGIPCVTVREQTERPITIAGGTNRLVGWPPNVIGILQSVRDAVDARPTYAGLGALEGWDGRAAERIVRYFEERAKCRTGSADLAASTI